MTRRRLVIGAAVLAAVVLVAYGAVRLARPLVREWREKQFFVTPQGGGAPVVVSVPDGASAQDIAATLEREGVVGPAARVVRAMRRAGVEKNLLPGVYRFVRPIAPREALTMLGPDAADVVRATIPEGLTLEEIAGVVAAAGVAPAADLVRAFRDPSPLRTLDPSARDLEGYLLPGTYRFSRAIPAPQVAAALVRAFERRFAVPNAPRIARSGRTLRELVTLASLVEKETARADERPLVAGVYLARLERGMRLQCDPTVVYASRLAGKWTGVIRRSDLERDHPYNTYVRAGLPPGPIASPGAASLSAVLAPVRTGALYFVARGDGSHAFSATLDGHNRNVRRFRALSKR